MSYGIRVKNPLPNPVKVEVVDGKTIVRDTVIEPGRTKFIKLDKAGSYDVRTTILDNQLGTAYDELGPAGITVVSHEDVEPLPGKPVLIQHSTEVLFKFWRDVIVRKVPPGTVFELKAVEIDPIEGAAWRLKISKPGDGKNGGDITMISAPTTFNGLMLTGGEIVKLQARSANGDTVKVAGRISGIETLVNSRQTVDGEPVAIPKVVPHVEEPEPEVEVRSLADMFEDMRKKEIPV